jgi:hypothetical protein
MKNLKYFTFKSLEKCNQISLDRGYNRNFFMERLEPCGVDPKGRYSIIFNIIHSHKRGEPCENHVRCAVDFGIDSTGYIDIPLEEYSQLPVGRF